MKLKSDFIISIYKNAFIQYIPQIIDANYKKAGFLGVVSICTYIPAAGQKDLLKLLVKYEGQHLIVC